MSNILIIAADLSAPPSEKMVFRDVTLYAKVFKKMDVIAISEKDMIDYYVKWFRQYGLFDFVDDILTPREVEGIVEIENGKLTSFNYNEIINIINKVL